MLLPVDFSLLFAAVPNAECEKKGQEAECGRCDNVIDGTDQGSCGFALCIIVLSFVVFARLVFATISKIQNEK